MPSEAETAKRAGTAVEKTNEVPLMHWCSTTICEPAQNPPDEFKPFATEPTIMSIWVAYAACGEFTANRDAEDTYGHVIQFRETTSSLACCAKQDTLSSRIRQYLYLSFSLIYLSKSGNHHASYHVNNLRVLVNRP
jgi:hypothetical protein